MKMKSGNQLTALVICAVFTPMIGCWYQPPDATDYSTGSDDFGFDTQSYAEYDELQEKLDEKRTKSMGEIAAEVSAVGNTLFWLEYPAFDPTFHSYDESSGVKTHYTFSIGSGDRVNYRTTERAIATAQDDGDKVRYSIYAVGEPSNLLDEFELDAPGDEQRWWAYALEGTTLYVITTGDETTLSRFEPGKGQEVVTTLESAGCKVGIFFDFGVFESTMVFVESGRIWSLDLATNKAKWLGNETEVSGDINFQTDGVLFETASGPMFFEYKEGAARDIGAEIAESAYALNELFSTCHAYEQDMTRHRDYAVYKGGCGIFSYGLKSGQIQPLLLEPRNKDIRIVYRAPVLLDNGHMFVTGLESESSSVGADGPVYEVDVSQILR